MPTSSLRGAVTLLAAHAVAIGLGVALGGCAQTKTSLERHAPTIDARSSHSVAELSACMSDNLSKYRESAVNYVPRPDGASLTYSLVGAPFLTVSMVDHGTYRQVTLYGPYGLHTKVTRHRVDAVRVCI